MSSTSISLMSPARPPNLRLIAAFLLALVTAIGGTGWYVENREFIAMQDVMEHNEVEFERVDLDEGRAAVHVPPGDAEQTALETYSASAFPHSRPYLGRLSASHLGRGFEDELVYAIRVRGWRPGPIIENDGEPQEFVVILPTRVRGTDGGWSIALSTEPPFLTGDDMR